jgi:hypothetical protein
MCLETHANTGGFQRAARGNVASDQALHLAYPSVAVEPSGDALIGFTYSAAGTLPDPGDATAAPVPSYPGEQRVCGVCGCGGCVGVNMQGANEHTHPRWRANRYLWKCCQADHVTPGSLCEKSDR